MRFDIKTLKKKNRLLSHLLSLQKMDFNLINQCFLLQNQSIVFFLEDPIKISFLEDQMKK